MIEEEKCPFCQNEHPIKTTPGIENWVHCPYDVYGVARYPGMENVHPRMDYNEYGVLIYVQPWMDKGFELRIIADKEL